MDLKTSREMVREAVHFIERRIVNQPKIAVLTGTGLGEMVEHLSRRICVTYGEIPHFPVSTVTSHAGRLLCGYLDDSPLLAMQGRFHLYEGYSPFEVTFPIRVMQAMGIKILILSNAAGGVNLNFKSGDIMVIRDHINLTGDNPLVGRNDDTWGLRFPDMTKVYDDNLVRLALDTAQSLKMPCHTGVYAGLRGPSLETPAETRFLNLIGADAVGFSTIQEAIAAAHAGMKILGLSLITNINDPDHPVPTTVERVVRVAQRAAPNIAQLIRHVLPSIHEW